jgi:hypothetical protein
LVGKRHLVSADDCELEFRFPLQAQQYSTRTRHNPGVGITAFERDIRPFTTGRKAWAFSNSTAGADASATIYSLMLTCRACGVEPYTYLLHVLTELPQRNPGDDITDLLPFNFVKR